MAITCDWALADFADVLKNEGSKESKDYEVFIYLAKIYFGAHFGFYPGSGHEAGFGDL